MAFLAYEATVQVLQPVTQVQKEVSAKGSTRGSALDILRCKLKGMVCQIIGGTVRIKEELAPALIATDYTTHAQTQFEDATLFLHVLTNGIVTDTAKVDIKNMSTAYAVAGNPGVVNIQDPDIIAVASNHSDSAGNKGFQVYYGEFID